MPPDPPRTQPLGPPATQSPGPSTTHPADPAVRASDAEREATADRLREACSEGRLTFEELTDRAEAAYAARTSAELAVLISDLPQPASQPAARAPVKPASSVGQRWVVAVLGDSRRSGRWRIDRPLKALSVLGDCRLDLRQAVVSGSDVDITAVAMLGDVVITVPDGVEVEMTGLALLGDKVLRVDAEAPPSPGAPLVRVEGIALLGDVRVESEAGRERDKQLCAERWRRRRGHRRRGALSG